MANVEAWGSVAAHPDEGYVGELFRARYLEMVRLAGLLGADDPEDVAQEAFTRLMNKAPDLDGAAPALAYLRAIVVNLTRNRHRHLRVARLRGPAADGIVLGFGLAGQHHPKAVEAFGYSRDGVARIVLHLPGGGQAQTSVFTYFGSSAVWLWKISLPTHLDFAGRKFTVTAYDGAGDVIQTDTLGMIG